MKKAASLICAAFVLCTTSCLLKTRINPVELKLLSGHWVLDVEKETFEVFVSVDGGKYQYVTTIDESTTISLNDYLVLRRTGENYANRITFICVPQKTDKYEFVVEATNKPGLDWNIKYSKRERTIKKTGKPVPIFSPIRK